MINNTLNCWEILKTIKLQRKDERCLSVNVMKIEKINCMRARLKPLLFFNGQSAAKPRTEEGSTTISYESRLQAIGSRSGVHPIYWDEDMVCTLLKDKEFNKLARV
jgi:hypothetical protein